MRFLLDDCAASRTLCKTLADVGHDVLSVSAGHADAAAEDLLALASEQTVYLSPRTRTLAS